MATESNSTRIAKNTIFLYLRSFFVLLISLYTSRVILEILGVEDFGIYNVVGGIIGLLSFLNSSMASTYQRYFNFEMGRKNKTALTNLFKSSITVQLIYAIIIVILAETIGLWFLYTLFSVLLAMLRYRICSLIFCKLRLVAFHLDRELPFRPCLRLFLP